MKRRAFLRSTVVALGAMALGACALDDEQLPVSRDDFPQSVVAGDPRPNTIILWTRVHSDAEQVALRLELSRTEDFSSSRSVSVSALAEHDHCIKVRVDDLDPASRYFYRFSVEREGERVASPTGRFRTAPSEDDDAAVRFAYVSCQDYNGRYFNNYLALAQQEVDFFVHLGDYIYETTGDPEFQTPTEDRKIEFTDLEGAIELGTPDERFYAAASLDNYRELYRIYRSDPAIQRMHESAAMIAIWDDHEFSNDCHGATATYFGGAVDEEDVERRKAANRAWFDYMPVDYVDPEFEYDPQAPFPGDITIYREFRFGRNLHVVMTDARTWRNDHPVPEDAFPGELVADQARLEGALGEVPELARPYVDIETFAGGIYLDALGGIAESEGFDPALLAGSISVDFINSLVADIEGVDPIDDTDPQHERGLAWFDLGKTLYNASFGSRNFIVKPTYDVWTALEFGESDGGSERVLGDTQRSWLYDTLEASDATFKVWGNEYMLNQLAVDLRALAPEGFDKIYYLSADFWDGHRNRRNEVIERLADVPGLVAITGDIHAFHAGTPMADAGPSRRIIELVTSSISSATFEEEILSIIAGNPALAEFDGAQTLAEAADTLFTDPTLGTNPNLGYANSRRHGFVVVDVDEAGLEATFHQLAPEHVREDLFEQQDELMQRYTFERFRVDAGDDELLRDFDGTWRRWDPTVLQWV